MAEGSNVAADGFSATLENFQNWFRREIENREQVNADLQIQLERCKQENADLQARLHEHNVSGTTSNQDSRNNSIADESERTVVSHARYLQLREELEITWKSLKVTHQAMENYKARYHKIKASIRPWQDYARKCHERAQRTEFATPGEATLPLPTISADASPISSPRFPTAELDSINKTELPIHVELSTSGSTGGLGGHEAAPMPPSALRDSRGVEAVTGISPTDQQRELQDMRALGHSPSTPVKVKSEIDSNPIVQLHADKSGPTETLDLDETGAHIPTPRKADRLRTVKMPDSPSAARFAPISSRFCRNSNGNMVKPQCTESKNDESHTTLRQSSINNDFIGSGAKRPLQILSPNRNDLPNRHANVKQTIERKRKQQITSGTEAIIETGDNEPSASAPKRTKVGSTVEDLLNDAIPPRRLLIAPAIGAEVRQQEHSAIEISTSTATMSKAPEKTLETRPPLLVPHGLSSTATQRSRGPSHELTTPLRARSITDLLPDDFQLNPLAHGNLDVTSIGAIRRHEDRRHLHGCTDPSCPQCGAQMRALAADLPVTVGSTLFSSTQDERFTDEERLLKHHLGDSFSLARVQRMEPAERAELVLQAKVQLVADRHGRHRLKPNARAKSPPGFWDMDMPTTQELEVRSEEMDRRTREIVKDRYREAMRPGGRWIFKDE